MRRADKGQGWILHVVLRWSYARWIQLLAHGDLLGRDGRPSQSKLAAFSVIATGLFCAIWQVTHCPPGTSTAGVVGAATVTIILAGLAASFGVRTFNHFLDRTSVKVESEQRDVTERLTQEITERRTGQDFETTP